MIIGAILDVSENNDPGSTQFNGASLIHFYTLNDAVTWAELQSATMLTETKNIRTVCSVINTDDSTRRWWWRGTEYTG